MQPPALSVMAEDAALGSVLANLMRNAIDAMQDAPVRTLRLEARPKEGRVLLSVTDTGPGIRPDILPRLFEPFVTGKAAGLGAGPGARDLGTIGAVHGRFAARGQPGRRRGMLRHRPARCHCRDPQPACPLPFPLSIAQQE